VTGTRRVLRWLRGAGIGLVVVVLAVGVGLVAVVRGARGQREAVGAIHAAGGKVEYVWAGSDLSSLGPPWPAWVVDRLGEDCFGAVVGVSFGMGNMRVGPQVDPERIDDALMARIGRLDRLKWLAIGDNRITDAGLAHLGGLGALERLSLNGRAIRGPGFARLARSGRLEILRYSVASAIDDQLGDIAAITSLRHLDLSGVGLTGAGLARLSGLTALESLQVSGLGRVEAADLAKLRGLARLRQLTIRFDPAGPSPTPGAVGEGLGELEGLADLADLSLDGPGVGDEDMAGLARLAGLDSLVLHCPGVTDAGLARLATLQWLRAINVRGTKVTPAGFEALRRQLPELRFMEFNPEPAEPKGR
jgi:hypothetical protein